MEGYIKIEKYVDLVQDRKMKVDATLIKAKKHIENFDQKMSPVSKEDNFLILDYRTSQSSLDVLLCGCRCADKTLFTDDKGDMLIYDYFQTVGYAHNYDKLFKEFSNQEVSIEKGYYEGCKLGFYVVGDGKTWGRCQVVAKIEK